MTVTRQDFTMWQGEDKTLRINVVDGNRAAYGSLAGLTFVWGMYSYQTSSSALVNKSTGSGITNDTSFIDIELAKADTENLSANTYYHECRVTDSDGNEDVICSGKVTLEASPTR